MNATDDTTVVDTPAGITTWAWLSRMHQLALELNTGLTHSRGPILRAMYREGLIDTELRGTRANKLAVLRLMVETTREQLPEWQPSPSVLRALTGEKP